MKKIVATTLLCALTLTAHAQTAFYKHPFVMGIGIHSGQGRTPFAKADPVLQYAGATSVRQEVYWGRLELKPGELQFPGNLHDVEAFVDRFSKAGGAPLLVLDYGNKLYDGGDGVFSDEGIAAFANYAKFVAHYFKGRVKFYDVWNEWDNGLGSNRNPRTVRDVATYIKLLKATYKSVKTADPDAIVLGGVVTSFNKKWIDEFIKEGGLDYMDGFSTHPYLMWNIRSKPEHSIKSLDELQAKFIEARPTRKIPIYITEIGWPNHKSPISWTPEQTADFLLRLHILARTKPYIGGIWWYSLVNDAREQDDKEKTFGLVDYDYNPKPALKAYKQAATIINQTESAVQRPQSNGSDEFDIDLTLKRETRCVAKWLSASSRLIVESEKPKPGTRIIWGNTDQIGETPLITCTSK